MTMTKAAFFLAQALRSRQTLSSTMAGAQNYPDQADHSQFIPFAGRQR